MPNRFAFHGASSGAWRVLSMQPVVGDGLSLVSHIDVGPAGMAAVQACAWTLHGLISNLRYATRTEVDGLRARQEGLGRPGATLAAMIPIRKSPAWWAMAQDERRAIFEDQSRQTAIGMDYLPAIARQLYHSRDLGEPFDFITWFEYAPEQADAFEQLVARLRRSAEWRFVDREIDIRLERAA
jgi:hypothetical protein